MQTTINLDREIGRRDTRRHPIPPFRIKAKTAHEIVKGPLVDIVVGFFQVLLANNTSDT